VSPAAQARVPRAEARRRILSAAGRLLAERPLRDLTVDAVMAEAGLARTVFYRHFDDLPRLVLGLLDDLLAAVLADAAAAEVPTGPAALRRMLGRTVDFFAAHGHLMRAFEEAARLDAQVAAAHADFMERSAAAVAELLTQGVAAGDLRPLPAAGVARALTAMNAAYLTQEAPLDRAAALEVLVTVWGRTLGHAS
jgi:AcrR family transcriptional regulator